VAENDQAVVPSAVCTSYRDRYKALTGISLRICARCHDGQMRPVEHVARACSGAAITDTS
jgi:hypothetical protein